MPVRVRAVRSHMGVTCAHHSSTSLSGDPGIRSTGPGPILLSSLLVPLAPPAYWPSKHTYPEGLRLRSIRSVAHSSSSGYTVSGAFNFSVTRTGRPGCRGTSAEWHSLYCALSHSPPPTPSLPPSPLSLLLSLAPSRHPSGLSLREAGAPKHTCTHTFPPLTKVRTDKSALHWPHTPLIFSPNVVQYSSMPICRQILCINCFAYAQTPGGNLQAAHCIRRRCICRRRREEAPRWRGRAPCRPGRRTRRSRRRTTPPPPPPASPRWRCRRT